MNIKLDKKDQEIIKVLDENFKTPFSKIAKKVKLSKNSVSLRFDKLKSLISHSATGINNKLLGFTLVKVFYSIDFLDKDTEKKIIEEFKKHNNIVYIARIYGHYNLEMGIMVQDLEDISTQLDNFNHKLNRQINEKEIEIIVKEFYFRNNFIHNEKMDCVFKIEPCKNKVTLNETERKIISVIKNNPRLTRSEIAKITKLNPKTISSNVKALEKKKVIIGYYMSLDSNKLGFSTFKILIHINNTMDPEKFEKHLISIKNLKHISKMIGQWDYEIDVVHKDILKIQELIEDLKHKFPDFIKNIEIINFGRRMITGNNLFKI